MSHSAAAYTNGPNWSGKISRLSGDDLSSITDYVTGLPRSVRDHETNSLAFGPDGALYVNQGSQSAMGAPDNAWGDRSEELLSAAVLRLVPGQVTSPPLHAKTADGGSYDPFAVGAPLTIYASGVRNAYDLVWHRNGQLYVPVNGSAAGGSIPATPATLPSRCASRLDAEENGPWRGPATPAVASGAVQPDLLLSVKRHRYYGHPNPARCEYASLGGNPTFLTDPVEQSRYPFGVRPDRNWQPPVFNFGAHFSPNGVIEYRGAQWVARSTAPYWWCATAPATISSPCPWRRPTAGSPVSSRRFPASPIHRPARRHPDPQTGNLYVTELGAARITLVRPEEEGKPDVRVSPGVHAEDALVGQTEASDAVVTSTGSGPLSLTGLRITGDDAASFAVTPAGPLPLSIPAGATSKLRIAFSPTSAGVKTARLEITTDAASAPSSCAASVRRAPAARASRRCSGSSISSARASMSAIPIRRRRGSRSARESATR